MVDSSRGSARRTVRRVVLSLLVLSVSLHAAVGLAYAMSRTVLDAVQVVPGGSCVTRDKVASEVGKWLGGATVPSDVAIVVEGAAGDPHAVGFVLTVAGEVAAQRLFSPAPPRCEQLHETLGLAIALALRASLHERRDARAEEIARHERPWYVLPVVLLGVGTTPRFYPGGALRIGRYGPKRFGFEVGLLVAAARGLHVERPGGTVDLRSLAGHVSACVRLGLGIHACGGLRASALLVEGRGYVRNERSVLPQLSAALDLELALPLTERWAIAVGIALLAPLGRTRLLVRASDGSIADGLTLSRLMGEASIGPLFHF